jgi:hypothetical protein
MRLVVFRCPLKSGDIELFHLEECLELLARNFLFVLTAEHLVHDRRDDLPRKTILILEPTALFGLRICGKLLPIIVDLFLRIVRP